MSRSFCHCLWPHLLGSSCIIFIGMIANLNVLGVGVLAVHGVLNIFWDTTVYYKTTEEKCIH